MYDHDKSYPAYLISYEEVLNIKNFVNMFCDVFSINSMIHNCLLYILSCKMSLVYSVSNFFVFSVIYNTSLVYCVVHNFSCVLSCIISVCVLCHTYN